MKLLVLAIILFSLYLIYRLSFPKQAGKSPEDESAGKEPPDEDEAVLKNRFVLDFQRQPLPRRKILINRKKMRLYLQPETKNRTRLSHPESWARYSVKT
jgi:hypothetical protein